MAETALALPGKITETSLELPKGLTEKEWREVGVVLGRMDRAVRWWVGDWLLHNAEWGETKNLTEVIGLSYGDLRNCKSISGAYEVSQRCDTLTWEHHRVAVALPDDERAEVLKKAVVEGWSTAKLRSEILADRQPEETEVFPDMPFEDLPNDYYGTIYADPPWAYQNKATRAAASNHYETMSVDELCKMPVSDKARDASHLWMWTTNGFLPESFRVIEAWGFEYKSAMVWVKPQMGIGNYVRVSHEFLLIGTRGGLTGLATDEMSWHECDRTKHSKKPNRFRQVIEKVSPAPRLEMFGREQVAGWHVWGNEVECMLL